jgi:hypothetical protein
MYMDEIEPVLLILGNRPQTAKERKERGHTLPAVLGGKWSQCDMFKQKAFYLGHHMMGLQYPNLMANTSLVFAKVVGMVRDTIS